MLKKTLCAGLLAVSASASHAAVQSFDFSFTGFFYQYFSNSESQSPWRPDGYSPDRTLKGSFAGEDLNHDGVLGKSELTQLTVEYTDFFAEPLPYRSYQIDSFSYKIGGALDFATSEGYYDEATSSSTTIQTGVAQVNTRYSPCCTDVNRYFWTPATQLHVTNTSPVPEPATYAMLLLGLLGAGGLHARRRRG